MHEFERMVLRNIEQHRLALQPDRPVLVAVSGGADSVALLAALCSIGLPCVSAHCNFHLRGEESNRDMRHVQSVCAALGSDLYVRDFNVDQRRKQTGESVEMACRELRYAWFHDLLDKLRAQCIMVAHHREDNVETFFLNLIRGSGISGLTGMKWRNGYVARPLLNLSRTEIERYLADKGIDYVVDSTNAQNDYARNKLRNIVLPSLEECFPGAIEGILATIGHVSDNRAVYDDTIAQKRSKYVHKGSLLLADLIRDEIYPKTVLFELLRPYGFNITHASNIIASASRSGLRFTAFDTTLELDRGILSIRGADPSEEAETEISLSKDVLQPIHILVSMHSVQEFKPERNANVAYFDSDILLGSPKFTIRRWKRGDRMRPFGMSGTKLLSDMYNDAKYSAEAKRHAWIMTRGEDIIWAVGLRASQEFSIVPETRRYLRLEWRP